MASILSGQFDAFEAARAVVDELLKLGMVEDDLEICEILQVLCEDEGHQHRTAATVQSAATLWREWRPACIFLT